MVLKKKTFFFTKFKNYAKNKNKIYQQKKEGKTRKKNKKTAAAVYLIYCFVNGKGKNGDSKKKFFLKKDKMKKKN